MSVPLGDIEQQLCDCVKAQGEHYASALRVADQLAPALSSGHLPEDAIARIHEHLRLAAEIEVEHRELKESWLAAKSQPGPLLREQLDRVQSALETLLPLIGRAEESVLAAKQRLTPQLEIQSRSARMRSAYASAAASAQREE
jgi:hypothetical protein